MGLELRILAMAAVAVLSGCDDRSLPSQQKEASTPVTPPAQTATDGESGIEIAGPDGEAQALPTTGPERLPLARILEIARARVPGEVIEVELDDDDGRAEYEMEILTADGRSIEMTIDAVRGTILESEED